MSAPAELAVSAPAGPDDGYERLAARLGKKHVTQEVTASFAGFGLVLLALGSVMTLRWFGRLV